MLIRLIVSLRLAGIYLESLDFFAWAWLNATMDTALHVEREVVVRISIFLILYGLSYLFFIL